MSIRRIRHDTSCICAVCTADVLVPLTRDEAYAVWLMLLGSADDPHVPSAFAFNIRSALVKLQAAREIKA